MGEISKQGQYCRKGESALAQHLVAKLNNQSAVSGLSIDGSLLQGGREREREINIVCASLCVCVREKVREEEPLLPD